MEYIIAEKGKAARYGFGGLGYMSNGSETCINEKDLMNSPRMTGDFDERVRELGGRVVSLSGAIAAMRS